MMEGEPLPARISGGACSFNCARLHRPLTAPAALQLVKMQENPNDIPEGETPHTVSMFARQVRAVC